MHKIELSRGKLVKLTADQLKRRQAAEAAAAARKSFQEKLWSGAGAAMRRREYERTAARKAAEVGHLGSVTKRTVEAAEAFGTIPAAAREYASGFDAAAAADNTGMHFQGPIDQSTGLRIDQFGKAARKAEAAVRRLLREVPIAQAVDQAIGSEKR